jgi:hypothetical protein
MMKVIVDRLKEPSTWGGIAVLLSLAGVQIAPEHLEAIGNGFIGLMAVLAVLMPEKKAS